MLFGGLGDDILDGGAGNDQLYGDVGNDIFVFRTGFGSDYIADFQGGYGILDCIDLRGEYSSFSDVLAASTQLGTDMLIALGDGSELIIANFYRGNFAADDVLL